VTEAQAYEKLGWPTVGGLKAGRQGLGKLILPLSGSDRNDWVTIECTQCRYHGVAVLESLTGERLAEGCVGCGCKEQIISGEPKGVTC
jgi:hypothetical protein